MEAARKPPVDDGRITPARTQAQPAQRAEAAPIECCHSDIGIHSTC